MGDTFTFTPLHLKAKYRTFYSTKFLLMLSLLSTFELMSDIYIFFAKFWENKLFLLIGVWFVFVVLPYLYYVMPYEEMEEQTGETPTEHPWPYLKPMFEIFVTKTDLFQFLFVELTSNKLYHSLQKLVFQPEKVCRGKVAANVS